MSMSVCVKVGKYMFVFLKTGEFMLVITPKTS